MDVESETPDIDNTETAAPEVESTESTEPAPEAEPAENTATAEDPPYADVTPPIQKTPTVEQEEAPAAMEEAPAAMEESVSVAEKPARTEKQSEHDEGAAKMLEEMREKYAEAFKDVPEKKRPKAKAWAARAAYFKLINEGEDEKDKYIREQIDTDRATEKGIKKVAKPSANNSQNVANMKSSVRNMVYKFNENMDGAVGTAIASVQQGATTSATRKAANRFVNTLKRSTHKLKSSLMRKIGSPNSSNVSNSNTNFESPYKTRMETVPVSNADDGHVVGSLDQENSGSAMNNSVEPPEGTITRDEENSSLNLDMGALKIGENEAAPAPTSSDFYKPYEDMKIGMTKPKSKKRMRKTSANSTSNSSGYESPVYNSENSGSNAHSIGYTRRKKARKVSVPPISNIQEF